MPSVLHAQEKLILAGNILLIICCAFYLAWWLAALRPSGAGGPNTGWLLIPAAIAGLLGVVLALTGILSQSPALRLLPGSAILVGGFAAYVVLLVLTVRVLKRPATTELGLIVGWGMLALAEVNALYGSGVFTRRLSVGFLAVTGAAVVISLVCYILYYRLDSRAAYIDGMIPLLLAATTMAGISCFMLTPA